MGKAERFVKTFEQSKALGTDVLEIWVDKETGVNYLYRSICNSGGLTVMLDRDGRPVVTPIIN